MILHQGENAIIGALFAPTTVEGFTLADYAVKCRVTNMRGKTILCIEGEDIITNNDDGSVACVISAHHTSYMRGLYFVSFELWANGEKVLSNEVEQITVIE